VAEVDQRLDHVRSLPLPRITWARCNDGRGRNAIHRS
jgi:hypothetical protein